MSDRIIIALAGNPNSGKSTFFNALTGARQHVANYPGVTVEKKEGFIEFNGQRLHIVDLPGTYSLTAYSQEELVARNFLVNERPHLVVDVLNAGALERNLYLAVQFLELGIPLILALNMMDEVRKQGRRIDTNRLSSLLGVPVVETVARTGEGKEAVLHATLEFSDSPKVPWKPLRISYGPDLDPVIQEMETEIASDHFLTDLFPARWTALKYLEEDPQVRELGKGHAIAEKLEEMAAQVSEHCQSTLRTTPDSIIADYRYGYISSVLRQDVIQRDESRLRRMDMSDRADKIVTHRLIGPMIMIGVLLGLYKATFVLGEAPMGWVENFFGWMGEMATVLLPEGLLRSLVISGIIDGVGGILSFVPLIAIIFILLAILEDSGYIARMAYMLDRVFRTFGLHGSSVMPFIVSGGIAGGCAVPGIMGARALRSPKEKLATILTAPFMPCGAKIPVFLMLAAAFFPEKGASVMFWITLGAWIAALLVAKLLRLTIIRGASTPFVMELPPYRLPTIKGVLIHAWERTWMYIRKAGTVILALAILIWAAMTFPLLPEEQTAVFETKQKQIEQHIAELESANFSVPETTNESHEKLRASLAHIEAEKSEAALRHALAGRLGSALEPLSALAGFDWRTNIALIGGFAAKEVIVSTLGTVYSLGEIDPEDTAPLSQRLHKDPAWSPVTALSMIVFVLLYAPCFVTIVVMARESSWGWALFAMGFNTMLAFGLATVVFQVGRLLN
ncbi:MAG TPA: ferrous iron transport protein B [Desulfonatronum sp.]|nr:ferrous iron transport protein B [Desulfonatronum sp.]